MNIRATQSISPQRLRYTMLTSQDWLTDTRASGRSSTESDASLSDSEGTRVKGGPLAAGLVQPGAGTHREWKAGLLRLTCQSKHWQATVPDSGRGRRRPRCSLSPWPPGRWARANSRNNLPQKQEHSLKSYRTPCQWHLLSATGATSMEPESFKLLTPAWRLVLYSGGAHRA